MTCGFDSTPALAQIGDYDNDNKNDILWRNTTNGQVVIWFMNGTWVSGGGSPGSATTVWQPTPTRCDQ